MSVLLKQTFVSPGLEFYGTGGGGGGGSNITASTITLQGSTDPLEITLPAAPNDGFSVRQGGATNALAILTIDTGNAGQAELGIRSLSTISGNAVPRLRFEQQLIPGADAAILTANIDTVGAGNTSTIATLAFGQTNSGNNGLSITTEESASLIIGENGYNTVTNSETALNPRFIVPVVNTYVPASGASQTITSFSTIASHYYEMFIPNLRVQNQPAGAPAAGAWATLDVDTAPSVSYLDTFDMASVSTVQNDYQKSPSYIFLASATGHNLVATGSLSNTLSTAITINSPIFIRDLGATAAMEQAIAAP